MVTIPWWFVRYGFPALALAAVTIAVVLLRPSGEERAAPAARTPAAPVVEQRPRQSRARRAVAAAYSVRSGDTLASIAERFGTTVDRLMELNPGVDPQALRVGQPLRVD